MFRIRCRIDCSHTLLKSRSYHICDKRKSEAIFSQQLMLQIGNLYFVSTREARGPCCVVVFTLTLLSTPSDLLFNLTVKSSKNRMF